MRTGNLGRFNAALQTYLDVFIRMGTYLVLEKAKTLVYRNLLKRVYQMDTTKKAHQLELTKLEAVFHNLCGENLSLDEIECIVANLIYNGYVKGYISHEKRTLVLSKNQPFPIEAVRSMREG